MAKKKMSKADKLQQAQNDLWEAGILSWNLKAKQKAICTLSHVFYIGENITPRDHSATMIIVISSGIFSTGTWGRTLEFVIQYCLQPSSPYSLCKIV